MCNGRYIGDLETFLSRLEHYVNLDTPSGDKAALDAQGIQLREEFLAAGACVTTHERPGGNLLECRIGTGPRQILLLGHMDTVFRKEPWPSIPIPGREISLGVPVCWI